MAFPSFLRWLFAPSGGDEAATEDASSIQEQINSTYMASSPTQEDWYWGRLATGGEEDYYWRRLSDNWLQKDVIPSTYLEIKRTFGRTAVFISYSHLDAKYLTRLRTHLTLYERSGVLDIWDDTKIAGGALWHEEIKKALKRAKIAILLVSADFLASKFIAENELPPLLAAAKTGGARILPVILSPCGFEDTELAKYQSMNPPSRPLTKMSFHQREELWVKVGGIIGKTGLSPVLVENESLDLSESEYDPLSFYVNYGPRPSQATVRTQEQFIFLRSRAGAIENYMLDVVKEVLEDIDRISRELITGPFIVDKDEFMWLGTREFLMFRGAFFDDKYSNVILYIDLIHDKSIQPTLDEERIKEEFHHGAAGESGIVALVEPCIIGELTGSDSFFQLSDEYYDRFPFHGSEYTN